MADGIIGYPDYRGTTFFGEVTSIISPTQFAVATLSGKGDNFFQDWDVYVVRKGTGTGFAPQGDKSPCSAYVSNAGVFTHGGFDTTALVVGDWVYLMHPFLGNNTNIMDFPSNDLKQTNLAEVVSAALAYTKVKELAFTGKVGGARITFDMKVDNILGTARGVLYKNGVAITTNPTLVPIYTVWTDNTAIYQTFTQDISGLVAGDLIQIYVQVSAAPRIAYVRNFKIFYDLVHLPSVQTAIDTVYFDSESGFPGTDAEKGTASQPSNNEADVLTILKERNLSSITIVHGIFTCPQNMVGIRWVGNKWIDPNTLYTDNWVDLNDFTLYKCSGDGINFVNSGPGGTDELNESGYFNHCNIQINSMSYCENFNKCQIYVTNTMLDCNNFTDCDIIAGTMDNCANFVSCSFVYAVLMDTCMNFWNCGIFSVTLDTCAYFTACTFGCTNVWDSRHFNSCVILRDMQFDYTAFTGVYCLLNFNGGWRITLTAITVAAKRFDVSGDISVTVDASCTAGIINVRGHVNLTNNTGGATVNDYTILGNMSASSGLIFMGTVTAVPGANQFTIPALIGKGDTAFVDWKAFVFWDAGGANAAPQGEAKEVTAYVSATGVFTTAPYSAAVGVGDVIMLINPNINDSGVAYIASVTEATSVTQFKAASLAGKGETFFVGWWIEALWDAGGAGAAPQTEWRMCTAYTSATGLFTHGSFSAQLALTDLVKLVSPEEYAAMTIRGGGETLQSIHDVQQEELDIARNPRSASTLMTGAEQTVYEELDTNPYAFLGGFIDLSVLLAVDTVLVRVYAKLISGGTYRQLSDDAVNSYSGVQAVPLKHINGPGDIYNMYGFKVTLTQTAGTYRTITHSWYDAKRGI